MANRLSRSLDHIEAHTPSAISRAKSDAGTVGKTGSRLSRAIMYIPRLGVEGIRVMSLLPTCLSSKAVLEIWCADNTKLEKIVTSKEDADADAEGVKNPPKVG
jgi:hypothetical protein